MDTLINILSDYMINDIVHICVEYFSNIDLYFMNISNIPDVISNKEKHEIMYLIKNQTLLNINIFVDLLLHPCMMSERYEFIYQICPYLQFMRYVVQIHRDDYLYKDYIIFSYSDGIPNIRIVSLINFNSNINRHITIYRDVYTNLLNSNYTIEYTLNNILKRQYTQNQQRIKMRRQKYIVNTICIGIVIFISYVIIRKKMKSLMCIF